MKRREFISKSSSALMVGALPSALVVGTLVLPKDANSETPVSRAGQLFCYAPDDVTIKELLVTNGRVKAGDILVKLSSLQAQRFKLRLASIREVIDLKERPFKDGRMTQLLETLKAEFIAAEAEEKFRKYALTEATTKHGFGLMTPLDFEAAQAAYETALMKRTTASIEFQHEPKRAKDMQDKLALAKKHLDQEADLLSKADEYLIVRAPQSGTFVAEVGVNWFLKKGARLGVLTI